MEEEKGRPQFYNKLMKLHIHNITREDFGKYKCLAKNSQGETSGEIELNGKWLRSKYPNYIRHKVLQPLCICDYITHLILEHTFEVVVSHGSLVNMDIRFSCIVSQKAAIFVSELCQNPKL